MAILGIGAMGCLFGARLAPHADVVLIGSWTAQLRALQRAPLRLIEPDGHESIIQLRATDQVDQVGDVDVVLILTKACKTRLAADTAQRLLARSGLAVTLQNGLCNLEVLSEVVGVDRATVGITTQGASLDGRVGVVRASGGGATVIGTSPAIADRVQDLVELLARAGFETGTTADPRGLLWSKLVVNVAINPLSALLRVPNGALPESPAAQHLMREAAREAAAVAAAQGIQLPFPDAGAYADRAARNTATNLSSMLQDVLRGAPTEIDVLCGAVIRFGRRFGVPTRVNHMLFDLVKALEETSHTRILTVGGDEQQC